LGLSIEFALLIRSSCATNQMSDVGVPARASSVIVPAVAAIGARDPSIAVPHLARFPCCIVFCASSNNVRAHSRTGCATRRAAQSASSVGSITPIDRTSFSVGDPFLVHGRFIDDYSTPMELPLLFTAKDGSQPRWIGRFAIGGTNGRFDGRRGRTSA
jgi:hypothetical protein